MTAGTLADHTVVPMAPRNLCWLHPRALRHHKRAGDGPVERWSYDHRQESSGLVAIDGQQGTLTLLSSIWREGS